MRLCVLHNLYYYNDLMEKIRAHLDDGTYAEWKKAEVERIDRRVDD